MEIDCDVKEKENTEKGDRVSEREDKIKREKT